MTASRMFQNLFLFSAPLFITALVLTGCATADMGYTTYTSPEDWIAKTKGGNTLPLAKAADEWSETKNFQTSSGVVGVQSKFISQQATTCTFEVKFTNATANDIRQQVTLTSSQKDAVYGHRFTGLNIPAGKAQIFEMEKRECPLKWGTSKDMKLCAECQPQVAFLKN